MRIGERDCTSRLTPMSDGTLQCLQCGWSVGPPEPNEALKALMRKAPDNLASELTSLRAERDALKLKVAELSKVLDAALVYIVRHSDPIPDDEAAKTEHLRLQDVICELLNPKPGDLREADAAIKEAGK